MLLTTEPNQRLKLCAKANIALDKVYDSLEEIFEDKDVEFVDALLPVQFNVDAVKLAVKTINQFALKSQLLPI